MTKSLPTVAIVGRPNVGKSSLFNRLIGKRLAIIAKEAGTTRDRVSNIWDCNGIDTLLVDTGGLQYGKKTNIEADVQAQAEMAIDSADLILFVVDTLEDLTVDDFTAADLLRRSFKKIILIANKIDHPDHEKNVYNIYELGFGEPIKFSSIHKKGVPELTEKIEKELKKLGFKQEKKEIEENHGVKICILGKPNAGKSSLVNSLFGSNKIIVSEIPGTTRDSIDTEIIYGKDKFVLTDTAGLRRPGKISRGIEKFSSMRTEAAIENSDVVVLIMDSTERVSHQDCHIAQLALEKEKGLILALNKIDLIKNFDKEKSKMLGRLARKFAFVPWAPAIFLSALEKTNIFELFGIAKEIINQRNKRIETRELNVFLHKITQKHLPASSSFKKPKFFYGSQAEVNPPRFVLFFRHPENLHFSYARYLENEIRKQYGFNGTAMEIKFKSNISSKARPAPKNHSR